MIFIKKLQSQESGYSGDKPNQRGKYILIPKDSLKMFPTLSSARLNDCKVITATLPNKDKIGLNIVYHNAKFFPKLLKRNHNEVRLYRSIDLDEPLKLDRDVIFIAIKISNSDYVFDSVLPSDLDYDKFEVFSAQCRKDGCFELKSLEHIDRIQKLLSIKDDGKDIKNIDSVISKANNIISETKQTYSTARVQQPAAEGDIAAILEPLIKSQSDFAKYLRLVYGNKCALRKTSLVEGSHVGLDAAHIQAHTHGGPLLPSNGMLLSSDLHKCFDQGLFSLDDNNCVVIHDDVPKSSLLYEFCGLKVEPIMGYEICMPYQKYSQFHRKEHEFC
ncbi:HNH endonuclease [Vibrio sp. PNB22_3_1]